MFSLQFDGKSGKKSSSELLGAVLLSRGFGQCVSLLLGEDAAEFGFEYPVVVGVNAKGEPNPDAP